MPMAAWKRSFFTSRGFSTRRESRRVSSQVIFSKRIERRSKMNPVRINTSRIIAVAFVLVVSAWPGFADERFKASSIKGDYGFTCTGTVYGNPFAGVGQVTCDGRSTCSGVGTINLNGVSLPWTVIGSYTLGADGRGQVTYDQTVAGGPA